MRLPMPSRRRQVRRDGRERLAVSQAAGALHMHGEVAVAEPEPGLAAELLERRHERPGLVAAAPAGLRIVETGQRIGQGVEVGSDMQAEMLEIIAGIGHHRETAGRQHARQAERQLGAADAARQRQHRPIVGGSQRRHDRCHRAHRNRSSAAGRIRARAAIGGSVSSKPETSTTGLPFVGLPHEQGRGGRDLVRKAGLGELQRATVQVGLAAQILERGDAGGAERDARPCRGARRGRSCR